MAAVPKHAVLEGQELSRIARKAGCDVLAIRYVEAYGRVWPVLELDCHDNENAVTFLDGAAHHDAYEPRIREVASAILRAHPNDFAAGVQSFVKRNVKYVREEQDLFQNALITLESGTGDCDKQARLVGALCVAGGLLDDATRLVGVTNPKGEIVHVCAQARDASMPGGFAWLETTIDARYGEAPLDAKRRLNISRKDLG